MVRGYLPPQGSQNQHRLPYEYKEGQGAHVARGSVIDSPESIILTGRDDVARNMEVLGLQEVPQEVAEEALSAWQGDGDPDAVVAAWQDADEPESDGDDPEDTEEETDSEDAPADSDGEEEVKDDLPPIPEDLEELDYHDELIPLAEAYGVPDQVDSRKTEDLIQGLETVRDS